MHYDPSRRVPQAVILICTYAENMILGNDMTLVDVAEK